MHLSSGTRLGGYEIVEPIGSGGMDEVYRARDTKLDRDVALKILPDDVVGDPERLARFEREAKLLASLNHPHIAAIHGLEEHDSMPFLVLELVEGDDLSIYVGKPLPIDETLAIGRQIAEALEEAHSKGVVHRDLKPANVKRTGDGQVKVLDFGLAKALTGDGQESSSADLSVSPTMTRGTAAGMILGTAGYMSPEQARGKPVDARSDIWAFGVVLFELLSGRRLFEGETASDVLAAVLRADVDFSDLPSDTPEPIHRLLRRCLTRDPRARLQHIGDARLEIDAASVEPQTQVSAAARTPWLTIGAVALAAAAIGALGARLSVDTTTAEPVRRFTMPMEAELSRTGGPVATTRMAVSPDGRYIAYRDGADGVVHLFLRRVDQLEATAVPDSENATGPFFSPDGAWVAFFADSRIRKVPVEGGLGVTVCDVQRPFGASWTEGDTIVFAQYDGIYRVAAGGGTPEKLPIEPSSNSIYLRWPHVLPGGRAVLLTRTTVAADDIAGQTSSVVVTSLDGGELRVLAEGTGARYLPTGHIVYLTNDRLIALRFDVDRLETMGTPFPVVENVTIPNIAAIAPQFAVGNDGTLVYEPQKPGGALRKLVWVDRAGRESELTVESRAYLAPRISPDGRRIAASVVELVTGSREIWTVEIDRNTVTRLTFGRMIATDPIWSPDGKTIAYASNKTGGNFNIFTQPSSGIAEAVQWTSFDGGAAFPRAWTPDGKQLLFDHLGPRRIAVLDMEDGKNVRLVESSSSESQPTLSPDGRFIAYSSDESGNNEIYVRAFPEEDRKWQVSSGGGTEPVWSKRGDEIFYRNGDRMMSVAITTEPELQLSAPTVLFERSYAVDPFAGDAPNYDVSPDGERFLMILEGTDADRTELIVVSNWFSELERVEPDGAE